MHNHTWYHLLTCSSFSESSLSSVSVLLSWSFSSCSEFRDWETFVVKTLDTSLAAAAAGGGGRCTRGPNRMDIKWCALQPYHNTSWSTLRWRHVFKTVSAHSLHLLWVYMNKLTTLWLQIWSHPMGGTWRTHHSPTMTAVMLPNECCKLDWAYHAFFWHGIWNPHWFRNHLLVIRNWNWRKSQDCIVY